ncbi:MAG: ankyrin repeat domain-containing protein [Streptosporangiales bacterium]|nr:ankyrin repeat domain-containing protein [Streptosporangiales bacterium]
MPPRAVWDGVTDRSCYRQREVERRDRLADAARAGDWSAVFGWLDANPGLVNVGRVGGSSGYTVLHQAAWHGTDVGTAERLLDLGAWRTLRAGSGERAIDIAERRGHRHLVSMLRPVIRHPVPPDVLGGLQRQLHALVEQRAGELIRKHAARLPQLGPLTELENPQFWFPVPRMYGGFSYRLDGMELVVDSWCRVVGGSGQTHRVMADGIQLVESGWG